jgi:hypothetical protein
VGFFLVGEMATMKVLLFFAALLNSTAFATELLTEGCDVGELYSFSAATCNLTLQNNGSRLLRVELAKAPEGDSLNPSSVVIEPHSAAYLRATIKAGNQTGVRHHVFQLKSDETGSPVSLVDAHGFVLSVLDDVRPEVDLGVWNQGTHVEERVVKLASAEDPSLKIESIISSPAFVSARVLQDGQSIAIRPSNDSDWGIFADFVKVKLSSARQTEAWLSVKVDIRGEIAPSSNPLDAGLMRIGNMNSFEILLRGKSEKAFRVGDIRLQGLHAKTAVDSCAADTPSCKRLTVTLTGDNPQGTILGSVNVGLPDFHKNLRIAFFGLLASKDVKIRSMDDALKQSGDASPPNLQAALANAVNDVEVAEPSGSGPLLKWSVMNDGAIYGYQIFRSGEASGPFDLISKPMLKSKQKNGVSEQYQYRDTSAQSGKTYWYFIGTVYTDGHKQQLTGPQKVVAK